MRRVRVIVSGRVQGVSYRLTTAHEARRLGIVGWVCNLPDGSVELEAEGTDEQVAVLLAWCEHGPPHAKVTGLAIEECAPTGHDREFTVTHIHR